MADSPLTLADLKKELENFIPTYRKYKDPLDPKDPLLTSLLAIYDAITSQLEQTSFVEHTTNSDFKEKLAQFTKDVKALESRLKDNTDFSDIFANLS